LGPTGLEQRSDRFAIGLPLRCLHDLAGEETLQFAALLVVTGAEVRPFLWTLSEALPKVANAITNKTKYSCGRNSSAMSTNCGAKKTNPKVANIAPKKDAIPVSVKASPALPFKVIG